MRRKKRRLVLGDELKLLDITLASLMSSGLVFDISQNNKDGVLGSANTQGFPGITFEGTDNSVITCGDIGSVKTFIIWFKPTGIAGADILLHFQDAADVFWVSAGTLTSTNLPGAPKFYVDGVEDATDVVAAKWQMMAITNATVMPSITTDIGRLAASSNCIGVLAGVLAFSKRLTATEIQNIYNTTKHKYSPKV